MGDGAAADGTADDRPADEQPADGDADSHHSLAGIYLRGLCMGAADAVPGVSGGTIALVTGVYGRLVGAITAVTPERVRQILAAVVPGRRSDAVSAFRALDGTFLLALGAGVLTAVIGVTRAVDVAVTTAPAPTYGFFFGLIAASAWALRDQMSLATGDRKLAAVAGFLAAVYVSGRAEAALGHGPLVAVGAGALAVSAMVLPGLSGALILILIGQYEFLTGTLRTVVDAAVAGDAATVTGPDGVIVVGFIGGGVVGLLTVAHGVAAAFRRNRGATLAFLIALVVGALRAPIERVSAASGGWTVETGALFVAGALVGGVAVVIVERYAGGIEVDTDVV